MLENHQSLTHMHQGKPQGKTITNRFTSLPTSVHLAQERTPMLELKATHQVEVHTLVQLRDRSTLTVSHSLSSRIQISDMKRKVRSEMR